MEQKYWAYEYVELYKSTKTRQLFADAVMEKHGGLREDAEKMWDLIDASYDIFVVPPVSEGEAVNRGIRSVIIEASEEELREALGARFDSLASEGRNAAKKALEQATRPTAPEPLCEICGKPIPKDYSFTAHKRCIKKEWPIKQTRTAPKEGQ